MEKLLCIKIASRGDLLLASPAFRMLRMRRPNASITLLVGSSCSDVAQYLPYFDEIHTLDDHALMAAGWFARIGEVRRFFRFLTKQVPSGVPLLESKNPLRQTPYTEVLIFHRDWRYGFLTWLAGIPRRRGFSCRWGWFFLTHPYRPSNREHHILQYLKMVFTPEIKEGKILAEGLDGLWQFGEGEKERALSVAETHGFKRGGNWVALGFGGGHNVKTHTELKIWPVDYFRQLALWLAACGCRIVWVGDTEDAAKLGEHGTDVNLAGKLTVAETAAVLSVCKRVVSNDTLILHLAEAMGVPTVGLFGPTDPAHYRPLGARSTYIWGGEKLVCSPCHRDGYFPPCRFRHRCMTGLSVESVFQKVEELK